MNTTTVPTFTATIYCGVRNRYSDTSEDVAMAHRICQEYVDRGGVGVTVTPLRFLYTGGAEDGVAVGLVNYPRFPSTPEQIRARALELAELLRSRLQQCRVSMVFPDETVMLSEE